MKVSLVVASGVHKGKEIPMAGTQFVIGRDEGCHLRPASPAVSKRHCAIVIRDGKVYLQDLGSTNGTLLNDAPTTGECEIRHGDRVKIGPLDFSLSVSGISDSTPLPESLKSLPSKAPSSATLKKLSPGASKLPSTVSFSPPSAEAPPKPAPQPKPTPAPQPKTPPKQDHDDAAAMLLGMDDDDGPPSVPEGSTVMELPAVDLSGKTEKPTEPKPEDKKPPETSSNAAAALLSKYLRRPNPGGGAGK